MSAKTSEVKTCRHCGQAITLTHVPERVGGRLWRWKSERGFYCPKAGGDCWHEPVRDDSV